MDWKIEYTKRFLKELSKLPEHIRKEIEIMVFDSSLFQQPYEYGKIEKMKGYSNKYKISVDEFRIGLTLDKTTHTLIFNCVAHRKEIYRYFP
jgi:mRNA interferase RelE/StbE